MISNNTAEVEATRAALDVAKSAFYRAYDDYRSATGEDWDPGESPDCAVHSYYAAYADAVEAWEHAVSCADAAAEKEESDETLL